MVSLRIETVKNVCGFIGIVEGLAWIIMCISYLAIYLSKLKPRVDFEGIAQHIYERFFQNPRTLDVHDKYVSNTIFVSSLFHVFVWLSMTFNVCWVTASYFVLSDEHAIFKAKMWCATTFMVFFWDSLTSFLLMNDYRLCLDMERSDTFGAASIHDVATVFCHKGIILVVMIASKGFFIGWIFNGFFGLHLIVALTENLT